jgi:putative addiction module component (TIGR02574 family)
MTCRGCRQPMFTSSGLHYAVQMGNEARTLLTEALELAVDDRAELAAELLASLDEPTSDSQEEVDRLWAAEIERRSNRVLSGESTGEPWDEARRRIESDLAAR